MESPRGPHAKSFLSAPQCLIYALAYLHLRRQHTLVCPPQCHTFRPSHILIPLIALQASVAGGLQCPALRGCPAQNPLPKGPPALNTVCQKSAQP